MHVSPGAYVRELDYSQYVPSLSTTIFGVVGGATKGTPNDPTLITNAGDLTRMFGKPLTTDYALQAALQYLRQGNQCIFNRVTDGTDDKASVDVVNSPSAVDVFTIDAISSGSWGNALKVVVSAGSGSGKYNLSIKTIIDNSSYLTEVETYRDVVLTPSTDPAFIETVINIGIPGQVSASQYITVDVVDGTKVPVAGTYSLSGGLDGISGLDSADYIGTITGQTATGLQAFANPETIDLNLVAIPGSADPDVVAALITFCAETRGDCMALIDSPFGLDVDEVIDWHNGASPYTHAAFNSSFAALYWPWIQIYDSYNKQDLWLPPSGFAASQIAYSDSVANPWSAPAGLMRGAILPGIKLEMSPSLGQRESLYGNGNAVNPIVNFTRQGIHIWGQRTLQRMPSALDRINVRRMLLYIEKAIATAVKYLVFEPNDPVTWRRFVNLVTPALDYVKSNRGLYDFKVVCDESTNPTISIDRNEMNGKIFLKPTKTAEIITIDFVLLSTGASFNEFI